MEALGALGADLSCLRQCTRPVSQDQIECKRNLFPEVVQAGRCKRESTIYLQYSVPTKNDYCLFVRIPGLDVVGLQLFPVVAGLDVLGLPFLRIF